MSEKVFEAKLDAAPQPTMGDEGGIHGAIRDCYSPSQAKSFDAGSKSGQTAENATHLDIPDIYKSVNQAQTGGEKHGEHAGHHHHHNDSGAGNSASDAAPIPTSSSTDAIDATPIAPSAATDAIDATPIAPSAATDAIDATPIAPSAATDAAPATTTTSTDATSTAADATTTASDQTGTVPGAYKMPEGVLSQTLSVLDQNPTNMTVDSLLALKAQGITGVRDKYQLPNDRPLTQSELDFIDKDFAAARAAGMPMIPIFSYTQDVGGADAPASLIETQLAQLAPVLTKNQDTIGAVELGFVGAWGEWNRSTNGNDNNTALAKTIYDDFTKALPDTPVAFRYVDLVRSIFGDNPPANVIMQNDSIGQSSGDSYAQKDAGSYLQPGDYQYIEDHHLMTIGENQEEGTPSEILSRIQQTNITAIDLWGSVGDAVQSSNLYSQILGAMKSNAIADGIPVS